MAERIIHCCWFGGAKTPLAKKCRASWARFAPDWRIREFELPRELPPFVQGAIAAKKWAVVSDWARMRALYDEGGVYFDYDVELIRPFVPPAGEWVASEWTASGGTWLNPGSGIALERGSAVARAMLEAYARTAFDPQREMMVWINRELAAAMAAHPGVKILPPEVFSPIGMDGKLRATKATLGIHRYALSWCSPKRKLLRWLSWHGGRRLVDWAVKAKHLLRGGGGAR